MELCANACTEETSPGPCQVRAQQRQKERGEDQPHVPLLHHAALLLHHHRVQERRPGQPRHQRGVLHRVPAPVSTPPQHRVGPVRSQEDPAGQEQPRHHRPPAGDVDPLLPRVPHHQRTQRKGKRDGEAHVAEVEHRRMDHHLRILEQRVQPEAVCRHCPADQREWCSHKVDQHQEEDLDRRQDGRGVGSQPNIDAMPQPQHQPVGGQEPGP